MTKEDERKYEQETVCHKCNNVLIDENSKLDKVRDHSHVWPGEFLGAAHNLCNLQRQDTKFIPLLAHNFSG